VVEAFPWDTAPAYLLRDRDGVYGIDFRTRVAAMGIADVCTAPRSPWQSPYVERMIGSIRRECLDHVVVLHERHLRRILGTYFAHYHQWRGHQALDMDRPESRPIESRERGTVVEVAERSGLYRYCRQGERMSFREAQLWRLVGAYANRRFGVQGGEDQ
jgi:hypothetical protein